MVLQSGTIPYEYANRGHRFASLPIPIGISGVLLEQAQFIITAEIRKWNKLSAGGNHFLSDFNIYVNPIIAPSGPYEPKIDGSTLGNTFYPAGAFILDHLEETRIALNTLFQIYDNDTDLDQYEYRAAWLQSLYPESPSGFYFALDPDTSANVIGQWYHRLPSETGIVDYMALDVLGSSGVLYDIDFAEVMFNPPPHIARIAFDTMHGRRVNNTEDTFNIQQFPIFPAFQKTDGSLIGLTGREPASLRTHNDYNIQHVSSGDIRLDGYVLFDDTKLYLDRNGNIFDTSSTDFTFVSQGLRSVHLGGNMSGARIFADPTAQTSGVYRIAAINRFTNFPNTTIESGKMSFWPRLEFYWPSGIGTDATKIGSTTTTANLGYHIFDETIWILDCSSTISSALPSGLAVLSPFTKHRLWVRYADQTPFISTVSFGAFPVTPSSNWSTTVGLTRSAANTIYRLHPTIQVPFTSSSGQCRVGHYNDMLDLTAVITSTSDVTEPNITNQFPLADADTFNDMWYDPTNAEYWVSNGSTVGFGYWKFDSTFKYINKYIVPFSSGITKPRGVTIGGQQFIFDDGSAGLALNSGIFPTTIVDGTEPYDNTGNTPQVGTITYGIMKSINGAPYVGFANGGNILDIFEVTGNANVQDGVYAVVLWYNSLGTNGALYILRIEEAANTWEIAAISRMETNITSLGLGRREMLDMPI